MNCARVDWTHTPDRVASCAGDPGMVRDDEEIARLLHDRNATPPKQRLTRDELFGPKAPTLPKNVCHDPLGSDGASLTRVGTLSDDDLRGRSKAYAEKKQGRLARGAIVGTAGAVRRVRSKVTPDAQVVFVYDDPTNGDPGHCVIRCATSGREEGDFLRTSILSALSRVVEQDV